MLQSPSFVKALRNETFLYPAKVRSMIQSDIDSVAELRDEGDEQ